MAKIVKENLFESELVFEKNPPTIFYHGGNHKLDLKSLQMDRDGLELYKNSGSSEGGYGFYVTQYLWSNNHDKRVFQPLYKEGTLGNESAEKYAGFGLRNAKEAYIYQIELSNDIKLLASSEARVDKEKFDSYLKQNVDGLKDNYEAVIFNKSKIKSIKLIYFAKDYLLKVQLEGEHGFDENTAKIIPPAYLKQYLQKALGDVYYLQSKNNGEYSFWAGKKGEETDDTKVVKVTTYKTYGSVPLNWKKPNSASHEK